MKRLPPRLADDKERATKQMRMQEELSELLSVPAGQRSNRQRVRIDKLQAALSIKQRLRPRAWL